MSKQVYDITAWCDRTFFAYFGVEAESPEQALALARTRVHDESAEDCDNGWDWDRFRVEDREGNTVLEHQDEHVRVQIAARETLAALRAILPYAENERVSLQECHWRDGGLEAEVDACEAAIQRANRMIAAAEGRVA